jgi:hypothetical protein
MDIKKLSCDNFTFTKNKKAQAGPRTIVCWDATIVLVCNFLTNLRRPFIGTAYNRNIALLFERAITVQ